MGKCFTGLIRNHRGRCPECNATRKVYKRTRIEVLAKSIDGEMRLIVRPRSFRIQVLQTIPGRSERFKNWADVQKIARCGDVSRLWAKDLMTYSDEEQWCATSAFIRRINSRKGDMHWARSGWTWVASSRDFVQTDTSLIRITRIGISERLAAVARQVYSAVAAAVRWTLTSCGARSSKPSPEYGWVWTMGTGAESRNLPRR